MCFIAALMLSTSVSFLSFGPEQWYMYRRSDFNRFCKTVVKCVFFGSLTRESSVSIGAEHRERNEAHEACIWCRDVERLQFAQCPCGCGSAPSNLERHQCVLYDTSRVVVRSRSRPPTNSIKMSVRRYLPTAPLFFSLQSVADSPRLISCVVSTPPLAHMAFSKDERSNSWNSA